MSHLFSRGTVYLLLVKTVVPRDPAALARRTHHSVRLSIGSAVQSAVVQRNQFSQQLLVVFIIADSGHQTETRFL